MRLTKKIDRQALHQAMRKALAAEDIFGKVSARLKEEVKIIQDKGDERDLSEIAVFLRFKPLFDDPKNGKPLTDSEFEVECEKLILAFANDDREKIYDYLDKWFNFAQNYNPPTEINNVNDALKHFCYLRAQQSLGVTKMEEYPEYVASRFPDMASMMKLQKVEQELTLQSMWNEFLFDENDVKINTATIRALDENPQKQLKENRDARVFFDELRPDANNRFPFVNALLDAFDLNNPNPEGEASVKKLLLNDWIKSMKGKNIATDVSANDLQNLSDALRGALGATETGYGIISKYANTGKSDLELYKTVFIDGISVFDSLPDPKNHKDAEIKLMDALANQTGVVTIVHIAEIDGKFEYKADVLDVSTGKNDNPEYITKITALNDSEQYRKAVFKAEKDYLDNLLIKGRKNYIDKENEKRKQAAIKAETDAPYANGKNDFTVAVDGQTVAKAFKIIEDGRKPYLIMSDYLLKDTYVDKHGNVCPNPLKQEFSPTRLNIDTRDFLDLILFTEFAQTLGIGDKDLTPEETRSESVHMIMSFAAQDHDEIRKYLDKMYDFLESYTPPKKIETLEDFFKTVIYMRVQQTSIVKRRENPWYYEERYNNLMDKADFSAFEAEYLQIHEELLYSMIRDTGLNVGSGLDYDVLVERANSNRRDRVESPAAYEEMDLIEKRTNQFHRFSYEYLSERRRRLEYADDFEHNYTFKLNLPLSALALAGDNPDPEEFSDCADALWIGCISNVYNSTFVDSDALRAYGFTNSSSSDAVHLIYIDGKSIYDLAKEANGGVYSANIAKQTLLSALVNQSGLVQFARIMKDGDDIKMELDTIDLIHKKSYNNPDYVLKMTEYAKNPQARYDSIKENVVKVCRENLAKKQAEERNKKYIADEEKQWKDFAPEADDLLGPSVYEIRAEEEKAKQARLEAYYKEQQEQWDNLVNADLDLFSFDLENGNDSAVEGEEELGAIEELNFETYKDGRYFVAKGNPNSAYSVVTMGELRELGVYFGGLTTQNGKSDFIEIDETAGYLSLDDEDKREIDRSNELASLCGIKLTSANLDSVIGGFILQNTNDDRTSVDKNIFEKEYKLLFGDLYATALHNINKQCCKNGMTITAVQMDQTLKLLNQVMMDSAMRVGYPQKIINGGYTDKQIKAVQENFVDKFVPQNSTEKAMRRAQANMQGFDYANIDWKNLNYADFKKLVSSEQTKLASNMANTPENQSKVAQTYKAMLDRSVNRSFFSKLFNLVRYVGERNAISRYKRQAMAKFAIDERAFDALCQVVPNAEVQTLKEGIETNYRNMVAEHRKDNSISELSSVKIGGMSERDSIGDLEFDNISRKDNLDRSISSSDDGDFELDNTLGANGKLDKDNLSVLSSNDPNRIKFTVEEANHEHADKDLKKKEEAKEERKEEIKNEKKGYEKQP